MKRKLFFLLALMLGLVSSIKAREDVTSTYLTDAALENETANWALKSSGGNHNWNGEYKYHESWHNTCSLSQTVTVPNGYYQISIQAVNSAVPSNNAKLTAVSGSNNASAYIRLSSAGGFADIAKQLSLNSDACRIYATVKVENGSLTVGFSQPNNGEWIVYGQFKLYSLTEAEYRRATILQTALESNANSWSDNWTNGGNQYSYGRERYSGEAYNTGKIIYKTFSNLPLGNYDVTVHAKANVAWISAATGDNIAQVYAGTKTYDIPVEAKTGYDLTPEYCYTLTDLLIEDGNLEVGIQNIATGGNWYNVALINLSYKGGCLAADAIALPDGGAMEAGKWYYFNPGAGKFNLNATDISKIVYTTDGTVLTSAAESVSTTFGANPVTLSATTYYIKSSSENNLTYEADSYDVTELYAEYNTAVSNANTAKADAEATQASANAKTALNSAIETYSGIVIPDPTQASKIQKEALETAIPILVDATNTVNASIADYANLLTAITNANNFTTYKPVFDAGVTVYSGAVGAAQAVYNAGEVDDCSAAITALTDGIHSAYESDYGAFTDEYQYSYTTLLSDDLTKWASSDFVVMTANEHWNGKNNQSYYEQSGAEWGQNSWSHEASQTVTLPAGNYVMSITARASADVTSSMSVKVGSSDPVVASLAHKGSSGRGIMTDGTGSYQDGTYANGEGRGWEYRFITFNLAEESEVTFKFNASTNAIHNWVSIAAPLLKGNVHPNQVKVNEIHDLAVTLSNYDGKIPAEAFATFADDITTAASVTVDTPNLDEIYDNLVADIATAESLVAPYTAFNALRGKAVELKDVPNDNAEANTTLATAINNQTTAANNATDVNGIETATNTLKTAMTTYAGLANPVGDGSQFDLTFMLTNPDLTPYWDGTWWIQPEGWHTDQEGGNFQVMQNNSVDAEDGYHKIFMEYYYLDNNKTYDNGKFNIYTSATLPEGTFTMSCYAFAKEENYTSGHANAQVYFYANDTQGSLVNSNKLTAQEISFVNNTEQEVKIGLKPLTGNTYNWMGIGYVELYKVPAKTYTVDEEEDWDYTAVGAGDVTLKRTIKAGINTVVFPFSMTQAEVEENFGAESKVYVVSSYDSDNENITFATHDGISANQPCLLKATVAGTSYEIEGRTIVATENDAPEFAPENAGVSMIGGYNAENEIAANDYNYVISGDKIYFADVALTMKGTRAYIKLADGNNARELVMILDDDPTAINSIEASGEAGALKDGKYFINGRFVIVNNGLVFGANGQLLK